MPNLLFGVLCLPGDQSHPFAQPTINPLACCICWTGLLGRAVFPPWNEGPNFGSYNIMVISIVISVFKRILHLYQAIEYTYICISWCCETHFHFGYFYTPISSIRGFQSLPTLTDVSIICIFHLSYIFYSALFSPFHIRITGQSKM